MYTIQAKAEREAQGRGAKAAGPPTTENTARTLGKSKIYITYGSTERLIRIFV